MNYRHAFHAGNFADVMKHALLSRILVYLTQKPAPVRFIDTHAGIGRYDLASEAAARSGEWRDGIGRLLVASHPPSVAALLAPYLDAVGASDAAGRPLTYPGSPAIAQHLLRASDRLVLCELHPADGEELRTEMGRDRRVTVRATDGYGGLKAALPPPERRGLVLIDPPFEERDEFERMTAALADALRRWATGVFVLWYPIKDRVRVAEFRQALRALSLPKVLECELSRGAGSGLRGTGLVIVNAPYVLQDQATQLLPYIASCFGDADGPWHWRVDESVA